MKKIIWLICLVFILTSCLEDRVSNDTVDSKKDIKKNIELQEKSIDENIEEKEFSYMSNKYVTEDEKKIEIDNFVKGAKNFQAYTRKIEESILPSILKFNQISKSFESIKNTKDAIEWLNDVVVILESYNKIYLDMLIGISDWNIDILPEAQKNNVQLRIDYILILIELNQYIYDNFSEFTLEQGELYINSEEVLEKYNILIDKYELALNKFILNNKKMQEDIYNTLKGYNGKAK